MRDAPDYQRIEKAIRFLDERSTEQPTLDQVADHLGMSPFHTQRLFTRWAGVSPKRFLQYVTLEHAKRLLRDSHTVLDATYGAGLSGPSRLHDLFVTLEGVTPGEFRSEGEGIRIGWGVHPSPFGQAFVAATERGLTAVEFLDDGDSVGPVARLERDWPGARLEEEGDSGPTAALARRIFGDAGAGGPPELVEDAGAGGPKEQLGRPCAPGPAELLDDPGDGGPLRLRLHVRGTNFQVRVWEALLRVPPGAAVTYADVARAIGHPDAARAVGTAVGRNPLAYVIPCHRVLRSTGAFGGYHWGPDRKRALLAWESARLDEDEGVA